MRRVLHGLSADTIREARSFLGSKQVAAGGRDTGGGLHVRSDGAVEIHASEVPRVHADVNAVAWATAYVNGNPQWWFLRDGLRASQHYARPATLLDELEGSYRGRVGAPMPPPVMVEQRSDKMLSLIWGDELTLLVADDRLSYVITERGTAAAGQCLLRRHFTQSDTTAALFGALRRISRGNGK